MAEIRVDEWKFKPRDSRDPNENRMDRDPESRVRLECSRTALFVDFTPVEDGYGLRASTVGVTALENRRLTDFDLQSLPVAQVVNRVNMECVDEYEQRRAALLEGMPKPDVRNLPRRGRGKAPFLALVAELYAGMKNVEQGRRARVLAERAGVSRPLVRRWLASARRLGLLPPAVGVRPLRAFVTRIGRLTRFASKPAKGWTLERIPEKDVHPDWRLDDTVGDHAHPLAEWMKARRDSDGKTAYIRFERVADGYTIATAVVADIATLGDVAFIRSIPLAGLCALYDRDRGWEKKSEEKFIIELGVNEMNNDPEPAPPNRYDPPSIGFLARLVQRHDEEYEQLKDAEKPDAIAVLAGKYQRTRERIAAWLYEARRQGLTLHIQEFDREGGYAVG